MTRITNDRRLSGANSIPLKQKADQQKGKADWAPVKQHDCSSPKTRRRCLAVLLATFGLVMPVVGCRGYTVGNQFLYRSDIQTVHVAMFESNSFRRFLGQRLTEAVIREIELRTPYRIVDESSAQSIVRGTIIRETKRSQGNNRFDEPRDIQVAFRVEAAWTDRSGQPLMQRKSVRIDDDVNFIPEGGQSLSTAQQKLIERIAREIVGQMESAW